MKACYWSIGLKECSQFHGIQSERYQQPKSTFLSPFSLKIQTVQMCWKVLICLVEPKLSARQKRFQETNPSLSHPQAQRLEKSETGVFQVKGIKRDPPWVRVFTDDSQVSSPELGKITFSVLSSKVRSWPWKCQFDQKRNIKAKCPHLMFQTLSATFQLKPEQYRYQQYMLKFRNMQIKYTLAKLNTHTVVKHNSKDLMFSLVIQTSWSDTNTNSVLRY